MSELVLPELCAHCRRAVDYETHSVADCERNQELNRLHQRCMNQRRELRRLNAIIRERAALVAAAVSRGVILEQGRIAAVAAERNEKHKQLLELMLELGINRTSSEGEQVRQAIMRIRELRRLEHG